MKTEEYADLVIPELEEAPPYTRNHPWTAREDAILRKYFMIRSTGALVKYFAKTDNPRTNSSIRGRASILKLAFLRCQKK